MVTKKREETRVTEKIDTKGYILTEEELVQKIDHAIGSVTINKTRLRYYGNTLNRWEEEKQKKGDPKKAYKTRPVIITENRQITSPYDKGNFNYDSTMSLKENRWHIPLMNKFITQNEDITYKQTYQTFLKQYQENLVFENEIEYSFCVIWDILTYHQDLLDKFLIIKREGVSGSAKSKAMKLSSNLSFNGRKWLKPNAANFFRYRHSNKSAIYIEEAENLFDTSKKHQSGDDELVEYLNASYERGNYVPRQNDKNINQTDEFDPAGFTQIGAINPIKGALEKRSITLYTIKALKSDKRGDTEIPLAYHSNFCNARHQAYVSSLLHYKEFQEALATINKPEKLANREWQLIKPILAMAHCIDPTLCKPLEDYIVNKFEIRDEPLDSTNWDYIIARILLELSQKANRQEEDKYFIYNERIKTEFQTRTQRQEVSQKTITARIKGIGFGDFICRNSKGDSRGLKITCEKVKEILTRNQIMTSEEVVKYVSEVSDCQNKDDKNININTDTLLTHSNRQSSYCHSSDTSDLTDTFSGKGVEVPIVDKASKEDLFEYLEAHSKDNAVFVDENFDKELVDALKASGDVFEPIKGTYKRLV